MGPRSQFLQIKNPTLNNKNQYAMRERIVFVAVNTKSGWKKLETHQYFFQPNFTIFTHKNSMPLSVYDVNDDLVRALVKFNRIEKISKEFEDIQENHDKVNYVEDLLVKYQQFSKLKLKIHLHANKNDDKAVEFRKMGNSYFSLKNKNYPKAFELYNKSICFAKNDSENLSIGYANRSAILFEWKQYKECLENINLARKANYPEHLLSKLDKREKDCLELMQKLSITEDKESFDFDLSYDHHPQVPFIVNCLNIKSDKDFGRYVYTTKTLKPGDLVAMEDPYCSVLLPSLKYSRCANCKKENLTLIPCVNCTSAMFCNQHCLDEATRTFHKFECPIIDLLFEIFTKIHLIGLRVVLTTLNQFDSIEECIGFCKNEENLNQNSFTLDYKKFSKKEHYKAIHGLVTNQDKRHVADLFQRAIICAIMKHFMFEETPLKSFLDNDEIKLNFFIDLLFQHLQTSSSNMHSVDLIDSKLLEGEQSFASAAYAFGSLLNHSCAPNTVRIYNGTKLLLFILRPIQENGVLYDNYGYHYATQTKNVRQQSLETQYRFKCTCEACEKDYPLYDQLPKPLSVPDGITEEDVEKLLKYDKKFAKENWQRYCEYLKEYAKYFPCSQISAVEESLKMALNILVDAIPLKLKYNY